MIDWSLTTAKFGITQNSKLGKRPRIICKCDGCQKTTIITVREKSRLASGFPWLCPSCVALNRSDLISDQVRKSWQDPKTVAVHSKLSKEMWSNPEYRINHSIAVKNAMTKIDVVTYLKKRYSDPVAKQKMRDIIKSMWLNETIRARHLASMNRPETKEAISKEAKKQWLKLEYREKMAEIRSQQTKQISSIQLMLYNLLDDLNVDYHKEGPNTRIGYYCFDCMIPSANLLIECHGDYWHSLSKAETRDKQKFTYISKYFPQYKIAYFWEREFYQKDRVLSRLRSLLGQPQPIIDFNFKNITIKKVDSAKDFLTLYHYLGPGRGGIKYGAYLNDLLIGVAIFSKPLRQNINHQFGASALECSRFCIHPSYQKRNFASWFISRCTSKFSNIILYAYSDATVGHTGTIYKAANWQYHHTVPPDYWYMDKDGFVMHKKTLYNRAQNLKMTETEFADAFHYQKVTGGHKECFIKQT